MQIEVGKVIPIHPSYASDNMARTFWRLSFRCDRTYIRGLDAVGQAVLIQHEREEDQSYQRRVRCVKPRNYVGPLLRLYNDYVFRRAPTRADDLPEKAQKLVANANDQGQTLDAFIRHSLLCAQVDRESYILIDRKSDGEIEGDTVTVAQLEAIKARPVLRLIDASSVVNWDDDCGYMEEALVIMRDDTGAYARLYTDETVTDIRLKKEGQGVKDNTLFNGYSDMVVQSIGVAKLHGYDGNPLVRLRPLLDLLGDARYIGDSQAGPISEAQQGIVNSLSLLNEEMYNSCFSQFAAMGVSAGEIGDVKMGSNRFICIPNAAASFETIGADPAQSEVIRKNILDDIVNLYRAAGIISTSPDSGTPESGVALGMRFNQLSANLAALAQAVANAEARIWELLSDAWGFPIPDKTQFHSDFDQPDMEKELRLLVLGLASQGMPPEIKTKLAEWFASRNLEMKPEEVSAAMAKVDAAPKPDAPFPPSVNPS